MREPYIDKTARFRKGCDVRAATRAAAALASFSRGAVSCGGGETRTRTATSSLVPGLLPPSPLRMRASDNYAWVY